MNFYIVKKEKQRYYYSLDPLGRIYDLYPEEMLQRGMEGNLYLGIITDMKKSMNTAFVNIGEEKAGILPYSEMVGKVQCGDSVLVQVVRTAQGLKGAKLTMKYRLEGKCAILLKEKTELQFSRKIPVAEKRKLKNEIHFSGDFGCIIRSGAIDGKCVKDELVNLKERALALEEKAKYYLPPLLLEEKPAFSQIPNWKNINEIFTNDKEIFEQLVQFSEAHSWDYPIHYREEDYFIMHDVQKNLKEALQTKIWLNSGAYLILEKTEAMYVIDVNTGKSKGASDFDKTAWKTNKEAAKEIARQIRLRNWSGIILVDFIDMSIQEHKDRLLRQMEEITVGDPIPVVVHGLTKLGLMEITRKKKYEALAQFIGVDSKLE